MSRAPSPVPPHSLRALSTSRIHHRAAPSFRRLAPLLCVLTLLLASPLRAQETDTSRQALPVPATPDTLQILQADSARVLPAAEAPPPAAGSPASELTEPIQFSAKDSLVISFDEEAGDRGVLFGQANVTYGDAKLDAYRVDILFEIDEVRAEGLPVDTGLVGRPTFAQGSEQFAGEALAFNLRTERGRVVAAQTAIEDGFIRAGVVKVTEDSTLYIARGAYTTCDCPPDETPSYSLRSNKMKVVDGEWIYTGPIQLYLFNIPTPLWLPFGFLPAKEGRRSGPLPPQYGEDPRGFYLRNWGWYQAINDYMDAQVQFGFWSLGSWEINPLFRYARRYRYSGQLEVDYMRERRGEEGDPDLQVVSTSAIRWNHNQTMNPTTRLNSNVNLTSQNYLRTVSQQYDDRVRPTVRSTINFNKSWPNSGRQVSVNLSQQQIFATGAVNLTLPTLSFTQNSRKPFARDMRPAGQEERWYEKITYNYGSDLRNEFNFDPIDSLAGVASWYDALFSPSTYRRVTGREDSPFNFRAAHRLNSSASFSVNRIPIVDRTFLLNLSPSLTYTETWYPRTNRQYYSEEQQRLVTESVSDWLALRQFSTSLSANTTLYGLFPVAVGPFQGLRHTVRPNLAFTYRPDFESDFWGYTRTYENAQGQEVRYPIVNEVFRGGLQKSMSFSVGNVFETKHVEVDSTGEQRGRTLQLLNVDFSSSYNFAADSFKLAPITASARTRLFDTFDLRANAIFSPYALDTSGTRQISRFLLQDGFRFARLTQFSLNMGTSFQSRRTDGGRPATPPRAEYSPSTAGIPGGDLPYDPDYEPFDAPYYNTPVGYADFAIPWSLRLDFSYGFTESLLRDTSPRAILNASFDFNLTPNWKVQGRSGYDFAESEMVLTNLSILRDFDCWQMSFSWVPFGPYQSYSFDLHVKSGHLRDILRLRQPRSDVKGRFGSVLQ